MILEAILSHAKEHPTSIAIVDDKRELSYLQLAWGANLMAGHIERLSDGADKIGLLLPPSSAFAVALMGTRWLGRIGMPLNYLLKPEELLGVVKDSGLKFVLTIQHFKPLADALTATGVKVIYVEDLPFASIPADRPIPARNPDDVAVILYTSGSSGVPKGVMLTNRNLESNALDSVKHARFTERTVFLGILPMFHTLGLMGNCMIPLMLGSKVVYQARFSPVGVFEAVQKHQAEVLIAVPTMFALLAGAKSGNKDSLATIKLCISGGEPLPVTLIEAFKAKFGLTLMEGFGLTETSPIVALSLPWAHKPGSAGTLIPDVQVRFVDENGKDLGRNQDGELWIKGPNVMKGYYNKPEETAAVLTPDGWFKTGDLARLDDDGFLFITGRLKDMIIMAGEKVFPKEIEDAIKQHPAVMISAVIGVKDPSRGEMPVAFIQLKPDAPKPTDNEIRAFVRERIAPYKTPKEVYFVENLPMTHTGKVQKRELYKLIPQA
jgi:long-chain acyl-CoA synthetase